MRTRLLAFGGVPIEVLYDNMRTVVIERNTYGRASTAFIPDSSTTSATPGSCRACASRTKCRRRRGLHTTPHSSGWW